MTATQRRIAPFFSPESIINGRMYLGSFDDSVSRWPWMQSQSGPIALSRHLILQSLLGPPVCFRIGNLLYDESTFQALLREEIPVLPFAEAGFVQLHTKAETINDTIATRLNQRTNSTQQWVARHQWSPASPVFRELERIDARLQEGIGKRVYSPTFNAAFGHFAGLIAVEGDPAFQQVYSNWLSEGSPGSLTRSDFEEIALRDLRDPNEIKAAMSVINSVNHYAYGVGLFKIESTPLIDTLECEILRKYTTGLGGDDGRLVEFEVVDKILRTKVLDVVEDTLKISGALLHPGPHWRKYAELLDRSNNAASAVAFRSHKVKIAQAIRDCMNGTLVKENRAILADSCRKMSDVIRVHLGFAPEPQASIMVKATIGTARLVKKAAVNQATQGFSELLYDPAVRVVDWLFAVGHEGVNERIERAVDTVTFRAKKDIQPIRPALRSALSWRYMDREACAADGLL